jgi:polyhydroxyalkanoate synthesis repressor PhaR
MVAVRAECEVLAMVYEIKRYPNRKLYDAQERRYVTFGALEGLVRSGTEISVVDVGTRADVTSIVLAQIILEGERSHRGTLPPAFLHQLIKHGEVWREFVKQSLTSSLEGLMTSRREVDRVVREWTARAGCVASGATEPETKKWGQRAGTDALRDDAAALRKKLRSLEGRLEKNREK